MAAGATRIETRHGGIRKRGQCRGCRPRSPITSCSSWCRRGRGMSAANRVPPASHGRERPLCVGFRARQQGHERIQGAHSEPVPSRVDSPMPLAAGALANDVARPRSHTTTAGVGGGERSSDDALAGRMAVGAPIGEEQKTPPAASEGQPGPSPSYRSERRARGGVGHPQLGRRCPQKAMLQPNRSAGHRRSSNSFQCTEAETQRRGSILGPCSSHVPVS